MARGDFSLSFTILKISRENMKTCFLCVFLKEVENFSHAKTPDTKNNPANFFARLSFDNLFRLPSQKAVCLLTIRL